jgi:hypothetical protein
MKRRRCENQAGNVALCGEGGPTLAERATPRISTARRLHAIVRRRPAERAAAVTLATVTAAA